jgi:hypothetical protein
MASGRRAHPGALPEEEEGSARWGRRVRGRKEEARTGSGFARVGRGLYQGLGRMAPRRPFSFSFMFSDFPISDLFRFFCKFGSNHFKQNPKNILISNPKF